MIDNILSLYKSPNEIQRHLSATFKNARKLKKHSRREAAIRTGVPAPTIRRFEDAGEISLRQLLMLCDVYGNLKAAASLFPRPIPQTMDELIALSDAK